MASPEANCGNCRFFDRKDAIGSLVGSTDSINGKIDNGYCRAPKGLILGIRGERDPCKMSEGTFEPVQSSLTENPPVLQKSPAL